MTAAPMKSCPRPIKDRCRGARLIHSTSAYHDRRFGRWDPPKHRPMLRHRWPSLAVVIDEVSRAIVDYNNSLDRVRITGGDCSGKSGASAHRFPAVWRKLP